VQTPLNSKKVAHLVLEDGRVFKGYSAGKTGTTTGEICFNTGMTGYQEIFTDPSYYQQIIVPTNAHIGNYGTSVADTESNSVKIAGLVMKNHNLLHSRKLSDSNLQQYLEAESIVGICDIDTRALVQHIRKSGAMNAIISSQTDDLLELKKTLQQTPKMLGRELSSLVSTTVAYDVGAANGMRIAAIDYGIKSSIVKSLVARGCLVRVFPANTDLQTLIDWLPQGFFLSNGPGDPATMAYAVALVQQMLTTNIPIFGICLGNQLLGSAVGIATYKMHNGHRGLNHPVKNLISDVCEITSQNHGFSLNEKQCEANENVIITHRNLNDNSIEGIQLKNHKAFSVQYHPEASPGPHDSHYLFDQFVEMIKSS
jgi:carbamoyl-phosphate synthase small subunit